MATLTKLPLTKLGEYYFDPASRLNSDLANGVGKELTQLREILGRDLTPLDVVAEAQDARSPLHEFFTWDDTRAAAAWRLEQARHLLRSIKVHFVGITESGAEMSVRAFINLPADEDDETSERVYVPMICALSEPAKRAHLIKAALVEAQSWRRRYEYLRELSGIFSAIDAALER